MKDLTGHRFTKLTVLGFEGKKLRNPYKNHPNPGVSYLWKCQCDCGKVTIVESGRLKNGTTKSCGCFFYEKMVKHGLSRHPLNTVRSGMIQRCTNPKSMEYHNYGGRGIKVCDRWLNSSSDFFKDMLPTWKPGLTLNRINNDGDYEPGNCNWVSVKDQSRNRRTNRIIEVGGIIMPLCEWAEVFELKPFTILCRIDHYGWTPREAVTIPVGQKRTILK